MQILPLEFYDRDTVLVARELLGKLLVHQSDGVERTVRIVEVEAYVGPHDKAAHSAKGLTPRNKILFGPPGHAYVYLIYGIHHCMNIVTERVGHGSGVLLRAGEPVANIEARTQGPGLLCRAMGIDLRQNGHDMTGGGFFVAFDSGAAGRPISIVRRPRVGVDYAGPWAGRLLRFYVRGNPYVSRP